MIEETLERNKLSLLATPGVERVAILEAENGLPAIFVFVRELTPEIASKLPVELEGFPVRIVTAVEPVAGEELRGLWRGTRPEEIG